MAQVDERGVLGEVGRKIDPSNIVFDAADCAGFKAVLRMGRSDKNKGHRAWGTKLFGDSFGTTQNGGLVLYVNGALVPIGEDGMLWKHGFEYGEKKSRWLKADGGSKWGRHVFGVIEMTPPVGEDILSSSKENLQQSGGGAFHHF